MKKAKISFAFLYRGGLKGIDESIFPGRMEIDWIHYYQKRENNIKI
jgi:hypothetical protein